ncbi:MAG: TPM domain-containing protein, partial [Casimicrobiaceae bacterium]
TDLTQTLSTAETQALDAKLTDWEARTTNQLAVLIVPTTLPEPIESYALRVAEKWQVGRKGKDNGALFVVAKNDKKMRIEVGYGLEGAVTDVTARRIIAENVAPQFRDGKFAAGIDAGVDRIISVVAAGKPLPERQVGNVKAQNRGGGFDFGTMLLILFIVVPLVGSVLRSIFGRLLGSTVGAGVVGAAAWFVAGSLLIGGIAAVVGFIVMIFAGAASTMTGRRGGGVFLPGGFGGGGGGIGGGGWSGGGGGFGGGGASGGWD